MNWKKKAGKYWLVVVSLVVLLVIAGVIAGTILQNQNNEENQPELENWGGGFGSNSSNLVIRGIVSDVKVDYEARGPYTYHVFPAIITLNITEVVWVSPQLIDEMNIRQLQNDTWDRETTIMIAYDKPDPPELSIGQLVESSGYYWTVAESMYGHKLVVEPSINESYVKPV